MFIEIEKQEGMTPITIDTWIKKVREDGFTPDEAMQVLKWSNFYGNIKQIVKEINKLKTVEERLAFKEFVLSAVDGRKTSPEAFEGLFKLALEGGYAKELLETYSKEKIYDENDVNVRVFIEGITNKDRYGCGLLNNYDLSKYDIFVGNTIEANPEAFTSPTKVVYHYVNYPKKCIFKSSRMVKFNSYIDYSMIENLRFENVYSVDFSGVKKMPKCIDVSDCYEVDFRGVDLRPYKDLKFRKGAFVEFSGGTQFPEVLDLSMLDEVDLKGCNLSGVKEIKFKKGASVNLSQATNLPENIDFSGLKEIDLSSCDLGNVKDVHFMEGAIVDLTYAKNIKKDTDISKLSEVRLQGCDVAISDDFSSMDVVDLSDRDLSDWDNMKFKEGVKVILNRVKNFPKKLDLSKVIVSNMYECDFSGVEEINFGLSKNVFLQGAKNLPEVLDFSSCESVNLSGCDLSKVKEIKLKNCKKLELDRTILPEVLDLSDVYPYGDRICFNGCNFSHVKEIKFKNQEKVYFSRCVNFPEEFDLSQLSDCCFYDVDLSKSKHLKFKEDAGVKFEWTPYGSNGVPEVLDVSSLNKVEVLIKNRDVTLKEIKFKEGAAVVLNLNCNIDVLDVSMCSEVLLDNIDYNKIGKIIFKDREQRDVIFKANKTRDYAKNIVKKKSEFVVGRLEKMLGRFSGGMGS